MTDLYIYIYTYIQQTDLWIVMGSFCISQFHPQNRGEIFNLTSIFKGFFEAPGEPTKINNLFVKRSPLNDLLALRLVHLPFCQGLETQVIRDPRISEPPRIRSLKVFFFFRTFFCGDFSLIVFFCWGFVSKNARTLNFTARFTMCCLKPMGDIKRSISVNVAAIFTAFSIPGSNFSMILGRQKTGI